MPPSWTRPSPSSPPEHHPKKASAYDSQTFAVDIHPAARIGSGIVIDHATNVVVGEMSVIGDNVTLLQGVTLGGTGKAAVDRHPKFGHNAQIWAGAKVLGNVKLGAHC